MLGSPDVLLLDEPYVGVGGPARRRIVDYMSALQKITNLSIVLTSHSMSDVEFLCNRIAIMTKGRLMCLGSLAYLKEKFGKGYTITVKMLADRAQDTAYQSQVINGVYRLFPKADMAHAYEDVLEFRVTGERVPWSEMFTRMARIKKFFKLDNFFITDTSLEQIFTSVTRKEASAAAAAAAAAAVEEQHQLIKPLMASTLGI